MEPKYKIFAQEFYIQHSLKAIQLANQLNSRKQLQAQLASQLPQTSPYTRQRVATKFIQRYIPTVKDKIVKTDFIKLINNIKDRQTLQELLYYQLIQNDQIVKAIANQIFYPYFIKEEIPEGFTKPQFRLANSAGLFELNKFITRDFVDIYAQKMWNFQSKHCTGLCLRILRQAGLLQKLAIKIGTRRKFAYRITKHSISPITFSYCLYHELLNIKRITSPTSDAIHQANFIKSFLLTDQQVDELTEIAQTQGYLQYQLETKQLKLTFSSISKLVSQLISQPA